MNRDESHNGGSKQEGGDATKDVRSDEQNNDFGSGNRQRPKGGATPETEGSEEGLVGDAANLGPEIEQTSDA